MKLLPITLVTIVLLTSCGVQKTPANPIVEKPALETNTIDIGNKTITTITGSYVQPIR